jgi:hypothetical protein
MATKATRPTESLVPVELIERRIYLIRGYKVMLDRDLADLYQVETSYLNRQVKRNIDRFPVDFMFQLNEDESEALRCQFGISNAAGRGGRRYLPYAFTQEGVAMLSSVLRSGRAVLVNVAIMRAFVRLREILISNKDLANRLDSLEKKYDSSFRVVFDAIRKLMGPPTDRDRRVIGFRTDDKKTKH